MKGYKLDFKSSLYPCLCLLLFVAVFPFLAGMYPILRFAEEQIDIHVYPDHIKVEGYYVYKNPFPFPVIQGFSFPLPVDQSHPQPVLIAAKRLTPHEAPISLPYVFGKHRFEMAFGAGEEVCIKVQYQQQAPERDAWYVLRTTKTWKHPLVQGTYRLIPQQVKITSSNYPLEPVGSRSFTFQKKNFMPQQDWHFAWELT
jgi:hypothetical protein